jgi:hypothetical protein
MLLTIPDELLELLGGHIQIDIVKNNLLHAAMLKVANEPHRKRGAA